VKITSVDIIDVANDLHAATNKWRPVIVRINTDEGISGLGEIGLAFGAGASGGIGMARDLAPLIIGMNPMDNEAIWEKLFTKSFWGQGGGGILSAAMSGLDTAVWDIKAKALNVPLYLLLGGKTNESLRAYASQLHLGWGKGSEKNILVAPEQYAAAARAAVDDGYDAVKVNPVAVDEKGNWNRKSLTGPQPARMLRLGYERLVAIRDEVGRDVDIIVEMYAFTDTTSAVQFGNMIKDLNIYYYEEPITPLHPDLMKIVADALPFPVASGERIYWRWGFRPFLEKRSLGVIQPDICTCGGITEVKKICDMARTYDIAVQIHTCGSPIATAVALHLETAIPNFLIHETHRYTLLEPNIGTCLYDYQPRKGKFIVPELPGIGQTLTEETLHASPVISVT
jgi:L-alanine-DL-glutamate epimerase-like enolase superfamily enzyme